MDPVLRLDDDRIWCSGCQTASLISESQTVHLIRSMSDNIGSGFVGYICPNCGLLRVDTESFS